VTSYGISDAEAVGDGLTWDGTVQVFVHEIGERERPAMTPVREAGAEGTPTVPATLSQGTKPRHLRSTVSLTHKRRPLADAPTALAPHDLRARGPGGIGRPRSHMKAAASRLARPAPAPPSCVPREPTAVAVGGGMVPMAVPLEADDQDIADAMRLGHRSRVGLVRPHESGPPEPHLGAVGMARLPRASEAPRVPVAVTNGVSGDATMRVLGA
jgi:hypothetical protein